MKIIVGSENMSKIRSVKLALEELNIKDADINGISVESMVSSKPLNNETLKGARNRNKNLYNYCIKNNIPFDFLVSLEGGYEKVDDTYFIVTYASILDLNGDEFIGKSNGLQITERMFKYVRDGKSLNKVIESIVSNSNNKKNNGITGYLTNGYYRRDIFGSSAVVSAMQTLLNFKSSYKKLEKKI